MSTTYDDHLEKLRRYLKAIETGTFENIAELFAPDMTIEQLPNRIYPNGVRFNASQMSEGFKKGRKLFSSQTYEIKSHAFHDEILAAEVLWTGTLAAAFGNLKVGDQMRAHSAMFLTFQDGKIAAQKNYDCFEPW